jgi:hypothetical protein
MSQETENHLTTDIRGHTMRSVIYIDDDATMEEIDAIVEEQHILRTLHLSEETASVLDLS